jgi:lipid A disaccharide synthetase
LFVPEILQHNVTPENLELWLRRFATETALTEAMEEGFTRLRQMLEKDSSKLSAPDIVSQIMMETPETRL